MWPRVVGQLGRRYFFISLEVNPGQDRTCSFSIDVVNVEVTGEPQHPWRKAASSELFCCFCKMTLTCCFLSDCICALSTVFKQEMEILLISNLFFVGCGTGGIYLRSCFGLLPLTTNGRVWILGKRKLLDVIDVLGLG